MKTKIQNLKFFIIFLVTLCFPWVSLAREYKANATTVHFKGLVPCGKSQPATGEDKLVTMPCQFCHFFVMLDVILDFVIKISLLVAVLMITLAGLIYIVGTAFPEKISPVTISKAHSIMSSVTMGLVIIFAAWIIVNTIFLFLGVADWAGEFTGPAKWFEINCPIELPQEE